MHTLSVILITIILSFFTLVFGELVPKRVAMKKSEQVARFTCGVVAFLAAVMRPLIWLLTVSTNAVLRLVHIDPNEEDDEVSEEGIRMMVDIGEEKGAIQAGEKEMIENIFEFDNMTAGGRDDPPHRHGDAVGGRHGGGDRADHRVLRPVPFPGV